MTRTLIANLSSNDGFDYIYIAVEINESLQEVLRKAKKILAENQDVITSVVIGGEIISKNTLTSEIYARNIKKDELEQDECKIVNYPVAKGKSVYVLFDINSTGAIYLSAIDEEDSLFGDTSGVSIDINDILLT